LLSAISLIYWFGNQGVLKGWMQGIGIDQIYGAPGIVLAECIAVFPHTLMILITALSLSDARLYEAADAMGTRAGRKFLTITLPGAKYGLISAALVTFTLVMTDFGIPKVIGGNFNVLATDVFKLVIGQQDFPKGAVVAILLLAPAVLTFGVDHYVSRRQTAMLTARAVPYAPKASPAYDRLMTLYCGVIAALVLAMLGMAVFASLASLWPYNLKPSLRHYELGLLGRRGRRCVFQQHQDGRGHGTVWHVSGIHWRLPSGEDQGHRQRARTGASAGCFADGGPGSGSGSWVHLLLQRA
jgi:iron(III) transport system permease protein